MRSPGTGRVLACLALGGAVLGLLAFLGPPAANGEPAVTIAIDARPEGNGSRTVGTVDGCVSSEVGRAVTIDVVVPAPGIPADRGISAYQFWLLYDPSVVWVQSDDFRQLLDQAPGSAIVPISDPKPDTNGQYASWAVDFGPQGIEPQGSSETGPGVLARLTLLPRSAGHVTLSLQDVLLLDDKSQPINVGANLGADLYVGSPCPGEDLPTPVPSPGATPAVTPAPRDPTSAGSSTSGLVVAGFARTGGPPGDGGDDAWIWLFVAGAGAVAGGAVLVAVGGRPRLGRRAVRADDAANSSGIE